MLSKWPAGRRIAFTTVLCLALALSIAALTQCLAPRWPMRQLEIAGLIVMAEALARENLAAEPDEGEFLELDPYDRDDFETLVQEALDDLPDLLIKALDR